VPSAVAPRFRVLGSSHSNSFLEIGHGSSPPLRSHSQTVVGSLAGALSGRSRRVLVPAPHTFPTKTAADRYLAGVETDIGRGTWFDPRAG
jgi:hypothetical protein